MSVALFTCVFFCFVLARCLFFLICWILFVSVYFVFFFFFSSRRRHTRCLSDWSSDVCSSDLPPGARQVVVLRDDGLADPCVVVVDGLLPAFVRARHHQRQLVALPVAPQRGARRQGGAHRFREL